jgi:hypothetical protein
MQVWCNQRLAIRDGDWEEDLIAGSRWSYHRGQRIGFDPQHLISSSGPSAAAWRSEYEGTDGGDCQRIVERLMGRLRNNLCQARTVYCLAARHSAGASYPCASGKILTKLSLS